MFVSEGRFAALNRSLCRFARAVSTSRDCSRWARWLSSAALLSSLGSAHAVIVRGRITDPLGTALPGARVQLVERGKVVAVAYAASDGGYEIRSADAGRFTLLGSAGGYLPGIGTDFYGGATDVVTQAVVLSTTTVQQEVSVTASGLATPVQQLTAPVAEIDSDTLATRVGIVSELRQSPGVDVVQTGQAGGATSLFIRGGPSNGNKILIDGVPAEDVGGGFDFGTVSRTGIARVEIYRDPNSALYGSDSQTGVVSITTPRGSSLKPLLLYSGDAGNLHTYRNEGTLSGTAGKLDYLAGYSRFDTSNALQHDEYHDGTAVANFGYDLFKGASLRATVRNSDSAGGLPDAHDFYGISQNGKQGDQDLYGNLTAEDRTDRNWHNLLRYGIARKREQSNYFGNPGYPVTIAGPGYSYTVYLGNPGLIRGANGYETSGQAEFFSSPYAQDYNRDELYYQTDYTFPKRISALFGFRYDNERGSFSNVGSSPEQTQRTNYEWNAQFGGDLFSRIFYSFGGSIEKNHLYGFAGEPRLGLAYVPVRPGSALFRGTKFRVNASTGVQEPSLATEYYSLYRQLEAAGDTADIALYNIQKLGPERSRSIDFGWDQSISGEKLRFSVDFFHNQFSHQIENVQNGDLQQYFGISVINPPVFLYTGAELNSLAYRAQGGEFEITWQPRRDLLVRGGYTYLDAPVSQSFAGDAALARQGTPTENPNLPGIAIGAVSPLVGARPFRQPPNSGFFKVAYGYKKLNLMLNGALASRSDDSTFLGGLTLAGDNSLLLPNRNLDFGYAKLDFGAVYAVRHSLSIFTQVDNLLNNQHIGPIGYPGLPLTVRAGLKVRLGGE